MYNIYTIINILIFIAVSNDILQWSTTFLAQGTSFVENSISMTWTEEVEAGSSDNVSYREAMGRNR